MQKSYRALALLLSCTTLLFSCDPAAKRNKQICDAFQTAMEKQVKDNPGVKISDVKVLSVDSLTPKTKLALLLAEANSFYTEPPTISDSSKDIAEKSAHDKTVDSIQKQMATADNTTYDGMLAKLGYTVKMIGKDPNPITNTFLVTPDWQVRKITIIKHD